jgi:hypothetical protein
MAKATQNFFKTLVLMLAGSILVLYGIGAILSKQWSVETTRRLRTTPAALASQLTDLRAWMKWSLANIHLGSPTETKHEGEAGKVGQRVVWTGPLGRSVLTLHAVTPDAIEYAYSYERVGETGPPSANGSGRISWAVEGAECVVRWREGGEWENVIARWWGWFGAKQEKVGQFQISSLQSLQQELERIAAAAGK